ncbi:hypothetical protein ACFL1M_04315 [Patescibacteria group bacterium]
MNENKNVTEAALATYGTILAVVLSIAAFVVGFNKTNIFAVLAFSPMIIYFLHEFSHKLFPKEGMQSQAPTIQPNREFSFSNFLLQDSFMFRVSLSLFIVALVAAFAKTFMTPQDAQDISQQLISPMGI